jgi:hypothetical protein
LSHRLLVRLLERVMLLHSFGPDFKPRIEDAKAIRAELDRQSPRDHFR